MSQEIAEYMVNNNIKGNILNITSSSALRPGISPYIISKWGERSLTLGLAKKYLPYDIIVRKISTLPYIDKNGYWVINDISTGIYARGRSAGNPNIIIVETKDSQPLALLPANGEDQMGGTNDCVINCPMCGSVNILNMSNTEFKCNFCESPLF